MCHMPTADSITEVIGLSLGTLGVRTAQSKQWFRRGEKRFPKWFARKQNYVAAIDMVRMVRGGFISGSEWFHSWF